MDNAATTPTGRTRSYLQTGDILASKYTLAPSTGHVMTVASITAPSGSNLNVTLSGDKAIRRRHEGQSLDRDRAELRLDLLHGAAVASKRALASVSTKRAPVVLGRPGGSALASSAMLPP